MAQYLSPNNSLEIKEQKKIFEMRNRMTNINANYSSKSEQLCICGKIENMKHVQIEALLPSNGWNDLQLVQTFSASQFTNKY